MTNHQVVTPEEWVAARQNLLAKEKAFTKLRDQLSEARRDLSPRYRRPSYGTVPWFPPAVVLAHLGWQA